VARSKYYYWIVTQDQGRPYLIFGGADEEEARRKGLELLGGLDFRLVRYRTSQLSQASAFYRGERLENGLGIRESAKRQGHERSLDRLRRRRLERRQ
jgi:hypothetical protein